MIVSDVSCNRPRAYIHHHKLHDLPDGVTSRGQGEVILISKKIEKMLMQEGRREDEGTTTGSERRIFKKETLFHIQQFFWESAPLITLAPMVMEEYSHVPGIDFLKALKKIISVI